VPAPHCWLQDIELNAEFVEEDSEFCLTKGDNKESVAPSSSSMFRGGLFVKHDVKECAAPR
jgi:hypothetical protein